MNIYGYYSISNKKVKAITNAVVNYCLSNIDDLLSINIIGSSVQKLVASKPLPKTDIDFVILKEKDFDYKSINIDIQSLNKYLLLQDIKININYNGIRQISNNSDQSIDIILQSLNELINQEPHIVFDVARRSRIHIYGRDFYKKLARIDMTFEILTERVRMTRNYLTREIKRDTENEMNWQYYIAKSAILNTSYLFIDTYNTISKKDIYEYCKKTYPLLAEDITFLYDVYNGKEKPLIKDLIKFNNQYGDKLLRTYKLNNI